MRFGPETYTPSQDFNFNVDRRGVWTGAQPFSIAFEELNVLTPGTPHHIFDWTVLDTFSINGSANGNLTGIANFEGAKPTDLENPEEGEELIVEPEYQTTVTVEGQPIAQHTFHDVLDFEDKLEAQTLALNPNVDGNGNIIKPDTSDWDENKIALYNRILDGVSDILIPTVTYSVKTMRVSLPSLNFIAKITNPLGQPPQIPQGHNWLFMGYDARQIGANTFFDVTFNFQLSGPGGWLEDYYS